MAKVKIRGTEYELRVNLWATERLEEKYGDFSEAIRKFRTERKISQVKEMFAILANAGRKHNGQAPDITPETMDDWNMHDLNEIALAMGAAMDEAMRAETVGGNEADDGEEDLYAAEMAAKEKNG